MSGSRYSEGIVSQAEANICLTCESKRCLGICDRLKEERKRLKAQKKQQKRKD